VLATVSVITDALPIVDDIKLYALTIMIDDGSDLVTETWTQVSRVVVFDDCLHKKRSRHVELRFNWIRFAGMLKPQMAQILCHT